MLGRKDELGLLAYDFNKMAESLRNQDKALRESEGRLHSVLQDMPVMLDAFDENGIIVSWNKECERVTGFNANEIINNEKGIKLLYPDKEYRNYLLDQLARYKGKFRNLEWEISCKNGDRRTILWSNIYSK